ncbi:MAG: DUF3891 family protein [Bacteroidota bacterium]|nr:DUF3891 family protein [Bacteroidota bacterium]
MIVNYTEEGWQIITQRSHGLLAAQLAAQWKFKAAPKRWTETLIAIAEHDDAENELDGENLLTSRGGPLNFDMKDFDLAHCEKLSSLSVTKSRYIALLTSMHMVFLYSKDEATNKTAKQFLDHQRELQAKWSKELGLEKEEVHSMYSLLEWCDALSLLICKGDAQPEKRRIEISTGPDMKEYYLIQVDENALAVEPWAFETTRFSVSFERRTIKQLQFVSSAEFRKAFLAAPVEEVQWVFTKQTTQKSAKQKKVKT